MRIPLSSPDVTEPEIDAVAAVLRSGQLSLGPKLQEFEAAIADAAGTPYAVAVSSGTAALHLCMLALGISAGDEVIVPSFTFIAAANAIRYVGATPVFVDIEEGSLNLSPKCVEETITSRTRAILAVHTFGRPADMTSILAIAKRHGLLVIEDACEAIGAEINGRRVGAFGDAAAFGFYPNKQITTGEGGAVVTHHPEVAARVRVLRNQGRAPSEDWLQHEELGYNYRLSEIACVLGLGQLRRLEEILQRRKDVARMYNSRLSCVAGIRVPELSSAGIRMSWFVYVIRLDSSHTAEDRDLIVFEMQARGIGCGRYFGPIHWQPAYSAWRKLDTLPVTEAQASRTIALPFFNRLSSNDITEVCATLAASMALVGQRRDSTPG
jgi:perosamine synthetase